jgi:hypothetical protein
VIEIGLIDGCFRREPAPSVGRPRGAHFIHADNQLTRRTRECHLMADFVAEVC